MYDDTFNLLGIQGGGVNPPNEGTFFCNFESKVSLIFPSEQSFFNIFKSIPHTPLASAHAQMTHSEL